MEESNTMKLCLILTQPRNVPQHGLSENIIESGFNGSHRAWVPLNKQCALHVEVVLQDNHDSMLLESLSILRLPEKETEKNPKSLPNSLYLCSIRFLDACGPGIDQQAVLFILEESSMEPDLSSLLQLDLHLT